MYVLAELGSNFYLLLSLLRLLAGVKLCYAAGEPLPPDVPGEVFPSAAQSYAAMALATASPAAPNSSNLTQPGHSHLQTGHHHTHHHARTLLQSWDADRAASARLRSFLAVTPKGLHGHVHTAAQSLHGLSGQLQGWIGACWPPCLPKALQHQGLVMSGPSLHGLSGQL